MGGRERGRKGAGAGGQEEGIKLGGYGCHSLKQEIEVKNRVLETEEEEDMRQESWRQ